MVTLVAAEEVAIRQPEGYLAPASPGLALAARGLAAAALIVGIWRGPRQTEDGRRLGPVAFLVTSVAAAASGPVLFFSLPSPWLPLLGLVVPAAVGLSLGVALRATHAALRRVVVDLDLMSLLLEPFRLTGLGLAFGVLVAGVSSVGVLRGALTVAALAALLAVWMPALDAYLYRRPPARWPRLLGLALVVGELAAFGASGEVVSLADMRRVDADPVYAERRGDDRLLVVAGQKSYAIFVDDQLRTSQLDGSRYAEALVHPAMTAAERHHRVLLLGAGDGLAVREILRYDGVEEIVVIVPDRLQLGLATRWPWLRQMNQDALRDGRVTIITEEPAAWAHRTSAATAFDVIIADMPDPLDHVAGKAFTRYFYRQLLDRLRSGGVLAVQATSPMRARRSFATIAATVAAADAEIRTYRAHLPTVGEWGFVLAARGEAPISEPGRLPAGPGYVTATTLPHLFYLPRDTRFPGPVEASTLHDMSIVDTFARERRARLTGRRKR